MSLSADQANIHRMVSAVLRAVRGQTLTAVGAEVLAKELGKTQVRCVCSSGVLLYLLTRAHLSM